MPQLKPKQKDVPTITKLIDSNIPRFFLEPVPEENAIEANKLKVPESASVFALNANEKKPIDIGFIQLQRVVSQMKSLRVENKSGSNKGAAVEANNYNLFAKALDLVSYTDFLQGKPMKRSNKA